MPISPPSRLNSRTVFIVWSALMFFIIGGRRLMLTYEYAAEGLDAAGQVVSSRQMRRWPQEHWSRIYFVDNQGREHSPGLSHGGPALKRGQTAALKYLPRSPGTTAIMKQDSTAVWWAWLMVTAAPAGLLLWGWRLLGRLKERRQGKNVYPF